MLRFGNVNNMPKSGMRPIDTNLPPVCPRDPILLFDGRDVHCNVSEIGFTEKEFDKNMLVVGNIGSGKTNIIGHSANQLIKRLVNYPNEKVIILDIKGDYSKMLRGYRGNIRYFGIDDYDNCWNIFSELFAFEDDMEGITVRANEISEYLFHKQKSEANPYFAEAAALLFKCLLIYMIRKASETNDAL